MPPSTNFEVADSSVTDSLCRIYVVGLGSNLGDSLRTLRSAAVALAALPGLNVERKSRLYRSPALTLPEGPAQPDYLNAALRITSGVEPLDLLSVLHRVEAEFGRVRGQRWGARTLDLDVLWSDRAVNFPELTIPHLDLSQRWWALRPLLDVAPELEAEYGPFLAGLGPVKLNPARL